MVADHDPCREEEDVVPLTISILVLVYGVVDDLIRRVETGQEDLALRESQEDGVHAHGTPDEEPIAEMQHQPG